MKLWEVIKKLTENKDKKFVFDNGLRIYTMSIDRSFGSKYFHLSAINDKGADISELDSGEFDGNFTVNDDWQEVRQPVTWQEAFQAWIDGCDIRCEGGGRVSKFKNGSLLLDNLECPPSKWMMKNGTWYVED